MFCTRSSVWLLMFPDDNMLIWTNQNKKTHTTKNGNRLKNFYQSMTVVYLDLKTHILWVAPILISSESNWHTSVVKFSYLASFLDSSFSEDSFVELNSVSGITGVCLGGSWLADKFHHKMFITVAHSSKKTPCQGYYCFYNLSFILWVFMVCEVVSNCSYPPVASVYSMSFGRNFL